jgi:endoglucanase
VTRAAVLALVSLAALSTVPPPAPTPAIRLDQVGYRPGDPKLAVVAAENAKGPFAVVSLTSGETVFRGALGAAVTDADSGDLVRPADFSSLDAPGEYALEIEGVGRSWPFRIDPNVYRRAYYLAMRSYYGQRCGTRVDLGPEFPGYAHPACHLEGAFHESSGKTGPHASQKGWHDAGDYGRYVVNSGLSTGTLLWTWELFGKRLGTIGLDIPESRDRTPDLLDEVRWNLDWMLSMQDEDGGVWQKQTSVQFAKFVMPESDTAPSVVIGTGSAPFKSSCATADLAAVSAIASRAFAPFDGAYATRTLDAARKAWRWLEQFPDVPFKNPAGVATGEYGDARCGDERFWAAAELWRTTHEPSFEQFVLAHEAEFMPSVRAVGPPSWSSVAPLGLWAYAMDDKARADMKTEIRSQMVAAADAVVSRTESNGYRVSLARTDYIWGSNGVVGNYALQLLVTNQLAPQRAYMDAALDNLHYVLGRNTFSLSFVTGLGAHPFHHPHHRPSGADANAEPWPGLLSGGPNARRQDPAMKSLPELPPAKMYLDEQESYASNEVAINWNAPLVFLLASTLQEPHGHPVARLQ